MPTDQETLSNDLRGKLGALMARTNIGRTAKILGIARHTLARAHGGLRIQAGTTALIAQRLREHDANRPKV